MGLPLPLVIYYSKGAPGSRQKASYDIDKRNFLLGARSKILELYNFLESSIPDTMVYSREYNGEDIIFETDLSNRPLLHKLRGRCTLVCAEPFDVLRRSQDCGTKEERDTVSEIIGSTPIFFVPGFNEKFRDFASDAVVKKANYIWNSVVKNKEYKSLGLDKLVEIETEVGAYTLEVFRHLADKIDRLERA